LSLPAGARPRGGGHRADNGQPARVHVAGDPGRHRPGPHGAPGGRPRHRRRDRPGRDLDRPGDRLLLALSGRLLDHEPVVRALRTRAARPHPGRPAAAPGGACLMLGHEFMRLALLAGTPVALACGLLGYFVVLRSQVFAGDALSHVAFTGALAAAAAGVDVRIGLFIATLAVAAAIGGLGGRAGADDVVVGTVFAWILGLGALFLSIVTANRSGSNGVAGVRVLFGS